MNEPIILREDEWESVLRAVHELHRHQEDILKRLAALEAQTAPAPEYAPGWVRHDNFMFEPNEYIYVGIGEKQLTEDIWFQHGEGNNYATLNWTLSDAPLTLDANDLRELIGAAMAVLKRMEMGGE